MAIPTPMYYPTHFPQQPLTDSSFHSARLQEILVFVLGVITSIKRTHLLHMTCIKHKEWQDHQSLNVVLVMSFIIDPSFV